MFILYSYEKTGNFHPYPDPVKKGTVLVVIDETMTPMEFQQSLGKKPLTKAEKKKIRDKEKKDKRRKREKEKLIKMKEAKRRKKLRDAGIIDVGYELTASKAIGKLFNFLNYTVYKIKSICTYIVVFVTS